MTSWFAICFGAGITKLDSSIHFFSQFHFIKETCLPITWLSYSHLTTLYQTEISMTKISIANSLESQSCTKPSSLFRTPWTLVGVPTCVPGCSGCHGRCQRVASNICRLCWNTPWRRDSSLCDSTTNTRCYPHPRWASSCASAIYSPHSLTSWPRMEDSAIQVTTLSSIGISWWFFCFVFQILCNFEVEVKQWDLQMAYW